MQTAKIDLELALKLKKNDKAITDELNKLNQQMKLYQSSDKAERIRIQNISPPCKPSNFEKPLNFERKENYNDIFNNENIYSERMNLTNNDVNNNSNASSNKLNYSKNPEVSFERRNFSQNAFKSNQPNQPPALNFNRDEGHFSDLDNIPFNKENFNNKTSFDIDSRYPKNPDNYFKNYNNEKFDKEENFEDEIKTDQKFKRNDSNFNSKSNYSNVKNDFNDDDYGATSKIFEEINSLEKCSYDLYKNNFFFF